MLLLASGRFEDIIEMVIFTEWILYGMTTASVLVLRRTLSDAAALSSLGLPPGSLVFVLVAGALLYVTLRESPRESGMGLGLIALGLPFLLLLEPAPKPPPRDTPGVKARLTAENPKKGTLRTDLFGKRNKLLETPLIRR